MNKSSTRPRGSALGDSNLQDLIQYLREHGYPPIPVAPAFAVEQYPARDKSGNPILDNDGNPKPAFTGKNPSWLNSEGKPCLVAHHHFANRLPNDAEIRK